MISAANGQGDPDVPGDPDAVDDLVARFGRYAVQAGEAARGLRQIDSGHWCGGAAERFRSVVRHVPEHLSRSRDAFAAANTALQIYSSTLREAHASAGYARQLSVSAEAATAAWIADGAPGPDPGADDRARSATLLQQAQQRAEEAGQTVAAKLQEIAASAPAPTSHSIGGRTPALHTQDVTVRATTEHPLHSPAGFADGAGRHTTVLRYGAAHHVGFADGTNSSTSWESWVGAGESRGAGRVTAELLAGLGLGVLSVAAARRRRSRSGRTAMAAAGIDPAVDRRPTRSGAIGGISARVTAGWRTNLAHPPAGAAHWQGPTSGHLPPEPHHSDTALVLEAGEVVRHSGAPGTAAAS